MSNENEFPTLDLSLAAYLHSRGITLVDLRPVATNRCAFVFENSERIHELMADWPGESLNSNAKEYFRSYRHLLEQAKAKEREIEGVAR